MENVDGVFDQFLDQFDYHAPTRQQMAKIALVRSGVKELATDLYQVLPNGPDKSAAIRKLREVMMTANAAIVLTPDDNPESQGPPDYGHGL